MTITVTLLTDPPTAVSSAIKFTRMSPWTRQLKVTEHEIYGADEDILHYRGKKSRSCTLEGYCRRTQANLIILDSLCAGTKISIAHDVEGTRSGLATSFAQTPTDGGIFVTFSITVVEQ